MRSPLLIPLAENIRDVALQAVQHGFHCLQRGALLTILQTIERRFRNTQLSGEFGIRQVSPFLPEKHP